MHLARVIGDVVATRKDASLHGRTLLLVRRVTTSEAAAGAAAEGGPAPASGPEDSQAARAANGSAHGAAAPAANGSKNALTDGSAAAGSAAAGRAVRPMVAVDAAGAGVGELVLVVQGREASFPFLPDEVAADAAVVGIVDPPCSSPA